MMNYHGHSISRAIVDLFPEIGLKSKLWTRTPFLFFPHIFFLLCLLFSALELICFHRFIVEGTQSTKAVF